MPITLQRTRKRVLYRIGYRVPAPISPGLPASRITSTPMKASSRPKSIGPAQLALSPVAAVGLLVLIAMIALIYRREFLSAAVVHVDKRPVRVSHILMWKAILASLTMIVMSLRVGRCRR